MRSNHCAECGGILTESDHTHTQIPVSAENHHAHVDEAMAELVALCWRIGIVTCHSCQDHGGLAYLGFSPGSAERFVGAATERFAGAAPSDEDYRSFEGLCRRIRGRIRGSESPGDWIWQPMGMAAWDVSFAAHFPPSDIPALEDCLRRWL